MLSNLNEHRIKMKRVFLRYKYPNKKSKHGKPVCLTINNCSVGLNGSLWYPLSFGLFVSFFLLHDKS